MELHLYTAQIGKYKGPDAYDVTVKSGDINFAPTWDIVQAWKAGQISWDIYSQRYRELMLQSYKRNQRAWHEILEKGVLTLLCYCRLMTIAIVICLQTFSSNWVKKAVLLSSMKVNAPCRLMKKLRIPAIKIISSSSATNKVYSKLTCTLRIESRLRPANQSPLSFFRRFTSLSKSDSKVLSCVTLNFSYSFSASFAATS